MSEPRVVKKYPNRRLYDTVESRYITLADIRRLVIERIDFVVIDKKTQQDITRSILLQVIAEQEHGSQPMMSREFLREAASRLSTEGAICINAIPPLDMTMAAAAREALPEVALVRNVVIASRREVDASRLAGAFPWPEWKARAAELALELRPPPPAEALGDDVGVLPWWWGLHVEERGE